MWARCEGVKQAVNNFAMSIGAQENQRNRLEDAPQQLRALGVEQ
jgi:hypothetical protein